jgi:hypothetical protein
MPRLLQQMNHELDHRQTSTRVSQAIGKLPTLRLAMSAAPRECLEHIAALSGVPVSALSTVELSPGSNEPNYPALEYAAMHLSP